MARQPLRVAIALVLFAVVATLNSGGYRYGASDQAFYIPAILDQLDPSLYPRDSALVGPQARYFFVDEIVATLVRTTGWSIEAWFAVGYLLTVAVLGLALVALGRSMYRSPLATWALLAALTLRHRISRTGVNTLEGYFHPRVLVFAVGIAAIAAYLRGYPRLAIAAVLVAGLLHPTTAAFFLILLLVAIWTTEPAARRVVGLAALAGVVAAAWLLLAGPMSGQLAPMDGEWQALLASKDYLFPTRDWRVTDWLANLGTAALAIGLLAYRVGRGIGSSRERGLMAGAAALLAGFLVTLPLVAAGSALFVQLQTSRVFWVLDLLATAALVGALVDGERRPAGTPPARWRQAIAAVLVAVAVARGLWVTFVEHGSRAAIAWTLPSDDWGNVIAWARTEPAGVHFLADPGHAWKHGAPLRYAGRDVFLEEVKDTSMAIYSRESAERVIRRQQAIGDFETLDEGRAAELAATFGVDYLVVDRDFALPLAHREGPFRIYRLRPAPDASTARQQARGVPPGARPARESHTIRTTQGAP